MIDMDKIKQDSTRVCKYEIESHLYRTKIESVEISSNGFGLIKVVRFRGLYRLQRGEIIETYVDEDSLVQCEFSETLKTFDNVPFHSIVELSLKITVEEIVDETGNIRTILKLTRPKHLKIIYNSHGDTCAQYIRSLPPVDLRSDVTVYEQYRALGYVYDEMCGMQKDRLDKLEEVRLKNQK